MKAVLQSLDERVWQAVEIGWTKPMEAPANWDDAKLKDIVNSVFNLEETISESKIVRRVLRFLPEKFHAKITAIEESKNIDKKFMKNANGKGFNMDRR